jgi:anion-transporting  ArsA/GET3 family ATPase
VLDTPPTKHAIDFLEAPQKLSALFNEKITQWFRDPAAGEKSFFRSLIQTGTKQVLRALESLTGSEFMRELADFFQSIQQWQGQLEKRIADMHKLLVHPKTHFVLVTSFDEAKLKEAEFFSGEIRKSGYQLSGVLINRAYPKGLDLSVRTEGHTEIEKLYSQYQNYLIQREKVYQSFSIRMSGQGQVLKLPELMSPISDLEGVVEMAQNMEEAEGSSK